MPKTRKDREADLAERVVEDYLWAKTYRSQFEEDWKRYYRLYRSQLPTQEVTYPYESQVFVPYVFSIIETQLPLLIQQLFSVGNFVEVQGRRLSDESNAPLVKEVLRYQFEQNIQSFKLVYEWAKQALIYGTSPCLIDWSYQSRRIKTRIPATMLNGTAFGERTVKLNKVISNNPIAKVIDIFKYFQCPNTPDSPASSDDVLFAGWEFTATYEELLQGYRDNIYNDNAKKLEDAKSTTNINSDNPLGRRLETLGKHAPDALGEHERPQIQCVQYLGLVPDSDRHLVSKIVTLAFPDGLPTENGKEAVVLRDDDNFLFTERIPVSLCRVNLLKDELYGLSDIEVLDSQQTELNDQRNQRNDNIVRTMDKMWKKKRDANIDDSQLVYRPNGVVEMDNPKEDLMPLDDGGHDLRNAFTEEGVLKQDMQFASGVSDFIVGQFQNSSGFNDTATGISLIQSAAQNRVVLKGQWIQTAIREMAETVWSFNQQFLPFDTVLKVLDPNKAAKYKFIRATPAVIRGHYDFTISNAAAAGNPDIRRQQFLAITNNLMQMLPIAQQAGQPIDINFANLFRRILEEFQIPNIAEIFPQAAQQAQINEIPEALDSAQVSGDELDADTENDLILNQGATDIPTNPGDDDIEHIISHQAAQQDAEENQRFQLDKHISLHTLQLQQKKEAMEDEISTTAQLGANGTVEQAEAVDDNQLDVGGGSVVNNLAQTIRSVGN